MRHLEILEEDLPGVGNALVHVGQGPLEGFGQVDELLAAAVDEQFLLVVDRFTELVDLVGEFRGQLARFFLEAVVEVLQNLRALIFQGLDRFLHVWPCSGRFP